MDARVFVGDQRVDAVDPSDRGLAYGDGLFETMRAVRGSVPWWARHWNRLTQGADALGIDVPSEATVTRELAALLDGRDAVAKLILTRGSGARGYAPGAHRPTWILSRHAVPETPRRLVLRWCRTTLAHQPRLAGLKHCNRLEQVLARAEWTAGEAADDGLMLDVDGDVIAATAGNVFMLEGGGWSTPAVDRCGVRGVCRGWAMEALGAGEARITPDRLSGADAVFVCNAVRGILDVARLGEREWSPHPQVARLRERLASEHPAFAQETT